MSLSWYSWAGWAELTEKPNAHFIAEKINQKKTSTGRSSLSLECDCWILLLGYSQMILTHPALLFPLIFQRLSKIGLFHFTSCFHPNWSMLWFSKYAILKWYFILPDVVFEVSYIQAKRSSHLNQTGHHLGTYLGIVYKLPPEQGTDEGYVLVKHWKTFRTEKTLCHWRCLNTGWTWAS